MKSLHRRLQLLIMSCTYFVFYGSIDELRQCIVCVGSFPGRMFTPPKLNNLNGYWSVRLSFMQLPVWDWKKGCSGSAGVPAVLNGAPLRPGPAHSYDRCIDNQLKVMLDQAHGTLQSPIEWYSLALGFELTMVHVLMVLKALQAVIALTCGRCMYCSGSTFE